MNVLWLGMPVHMFSLEIISMGFGYCYCLYRKPNLILVSIINHLKQVVTVCVRLILVYMSCPCYPRIAGLHVWVYVPECRELTGLSPGGTICFI